MLQILINFKTLTNKSFKFLFSLFLAICAGNLLSGCSSVELSGNQINFDHANKIQLGDNANDVIEIMGSPTYVQKYGNTKYIYISEKLIHKPVFLPHVESIDYVVVSFDDSNLVEGIELVNDLDPDLDVDTLDERVKIEGNTVNPFKQIIGNIGKYNPEHKAPGLGK